MPLNVECPKIVFLDRATITNQITIPPVPFDHQWVEFDSTTPEQVIERLDGADIVITNKVVIDESVLEAVPSIKLIAVSATGYNNIDLPACVKRNIAVTNIQGYATQSVPEHVIAMMFALRRNLVGYHQDIASGEWQRQNQFCFFTHPIGDIAGATMGIIGSGALGQATAVLARAVGMNVVFAERKGATQCREGYLSFEQVLSMSDVVSLHCPLTEDTRNLVSSSELNAMKSDAILINTGRGGLVEESALVDALKNGVIGGAGVDVFTQEPADLTNPLIENQSLPNLILTPHVAWGSDSSIQKLANILIENITSFVEGREQNRVV